jgi:hypothetical protein
MYYGSLKKGEKDMNLKKLLLSTTLIFSLGLTGCQFGPKPASESQQESGGESESESESQSESQIEPVSRIRISAPENVVVGQEVNLDDYVTVEGGEGPKVYNVVVPEASADLVEVEGHVFTALEEGEINLKIQAGEREAKFGTVAMSALKAAFVEATGELSNTWAMLEAVSETQLGLAAVHRPDYSYFSDWGDNHEPGGFMKCQNGLTYSYIIDATGVNADTAVMSDFENYYCNFDFLLSAADFATVKNEETGEETLVMSGDVAGSWGIDSCPNKAAEFAYTLATVLNANYKFNGVVVSLVELGEGDDAFETFEFDLPIVAVADPDTVLATYSYFLVLDEEATEVTPVREYIDAGLHPEAIAFDEAPAKVAAIAQAKVYKVECEGGFYNPTTGAAIATPTTWLKYFPAGQETDYVTATAVYQLIEKGDNDAVFGKVVKDGVLYDFTNVADGVITDTLTATAGTGSDIWVDALDKTIGAANKDALWADFIATDRKENDDGSVTISAASDTCGELIKAFGNSSYLGEDIAFYGEQIGNGTNDIFELGAIDLTITVSETELVVEIGITYNAASAGYFEMTFTSVGVNTMPSLDGIVYPQL